jgi:hypothetical protein
VKAILNVIWLVLRAPARAPARAPVPRQCRPQQHQSATDVAIATSGCHRCRCARARARAAGAAATAGGRPERAEAVRLAVVASIRHEDTGYDELLMPGMPKDIVAERAVVDVASRYVPEHQDPA